MLDGTVDGQVDGRDLTLRAGDAWWVVGVGTPHTWHNNGTTPTRGIEAQCPQPPRRYSYCWTNQWEALASAVQGLAAKEVVARATTDGVVSCPGGG